MINNLSFETSNDSNQNDSGFGTEVPTLQKLSQSHYTPGSCQILVIQCKFLILISIN